MFCGFLSRDSGFVEVSILRVGVMYDSCCEVTVESARWRGVLFSFSNISAVSVLEEY